MSYNQTQASRRNYDDDSNYDPSGQTQDIDAGGDSTRSGAHGGSGFGQAGGYAGSQGRGEGRQTFEGGDNDSPGLPGNRGFQDTQDTENINVPGGPMGGEQHTGSYGQTLGGQGRSRGYERDNDEYDDSGFGQGQGQGAGTGRAPKGSMGSKVLGGVEKLAGKVAGKSELESKGEQRQSGF